MHDTSMIQAHFRRLEKKSYQQIRMEMCPGLDDEEETFEKKEEEVRCAGCGKSRGDV
jgi:hypothetical protein